MKAKIFDCVEMKRQGAALIHEEIKDMTFDQKVAYWEKANQEFLRHVEESRRMAGMTVAPVLENPQALD
jgi:hypothetical protein